MLRRTRRCDERGSATPLLAIVLGGVVLALSVIVVRAEYRVRVAQAQWAADAAALAAAAEVVSALDGGGPEARRAATRLAEANGARLVSTELIDRPGPRSHPGIDESTPISPTIAVEVELGGVRARAAAARFAVAEP